MVWHPVICLNGVTPVYVLMVWHPVYVLMVWHPVYVLMVWHSVYVLMVWHPVCLNGVTPCICLNGVTPCICLNSVTPCICLNGVTPCICLNGVDKETFPYLFIVIYFIYYYLFTQWHGVTFEKRLSSSATPLWEPNLVLPVCLYQVLRLGMPTALPVHNSYPWRGAQTLPLHFIHDMQPLPFCDISSRKTDGTITLALRNAGR
jgi:hypothetical protein